MTATETKLKGCFIIQPNIIKDERGYFYESYNKSKFDALTGLNINFVQDNQSLSNKGVLRGLHYQIGSAAQAKLVRVINGAVLDVAVDIRKSSPTFGHHIAVELNQDNMTQLFVPKGFAHGFIVLQDNTLFSYKCDNLYSKEHERGIIYNDLDLNINWQLPTDELVISIKDAELPAFNVAAIFD